MGKYILIFFGILNIGILSLAMEKAPVSNYIDFFPNEIYLKIIDAYIQDNAIINPECFSSLALSNVRFYNLCFIYYENLIKQNLKKIIKEEIDVKLADKIEFANIFEYCKTFNKIYIKANRLINKPLINLPNALEVNIMANDFIGLKKLLKCFQEQKLGNLVINYDRICIADLLILGSKSNQLKNIVTIFKPNFSKENIKKTWYSEIKPISWLENSLTNNRNVFDQKYLSMITNDCLLPVISKKEIINNIVDIYANKILEEFGLDSFFYRNANNDLVVNLTSAINSEPRKSQNLLNNFIYPVFMHFKMHGLKAQLDEQQIEKIYSIFQAFDKSKLDSLKGFIN